MACIRTQEEAAEIARLNATGLCLHDKALALVAWRKAHGIPGYYSLLPPSFEEFRKQWRAEVARIRGSHDQSRT